MSAVLDPPTLLQCPKSSAAVLSPSGLRFAQIVSRHDLKTRRTTKAGHVTDVSDGKDPRCVFENLRIGEMVWIDDETLLYLKKAGGETAQVNPALADAQQKKVWNTVEAEGMEIWAKNVDNSEEYQVGSLPVDASDLKIHLTSSQEAVLAFSAMVYGPNHSVYEANEIEKRLEEEAAGSDARVYNKLFTRHWDAWKGEAIKQIQVIHLGKRETNSSAATSSSSSNNNSSVAKDTQWTTTSKIQSPLASTSLESPVGAFGDASDFDISSSHLIFTAKTPNLNPAFHTSRTIYLVPLYPRNGDEKEPRSLSVRPQGATSSPVFSPSFKAAELDVSGGASQGSVAWLQMREDGYEADRNRVMIYDFATSKRTCLTEDWDRSPTCIKWSQDGKSLYLLAEDIARNKVFKLDLDKIGSEPVAITHENAVSSFEVIPTASTQSSASSERLLLSMSSMLHPTEIYLCDPKKDLKRLTSSSIDYLSKLDPPLSQAEEFWFDGAFEGQQVHGWLLRPPALSKAMKEGKEVRKYPLAFLIHGGPQGSWDASWSWRWNPSVFASAGYIVVLIDPTGSTSYGQKFTDGIQNQWGGLPYQDLLAGYQYVLKTYKEIDSERTVALGASYGGYMINWINGHNDAFGFKALVCHDGVFDTTDIWYSGEECYFPEHDFSGTPFDNPSSYEKWNPQNHIANWKTPTLIIQGGKDFRLPETQALGCFNTLQKLGIPSRLVYFESENHWVLDPANSLRWHKEILGWMEEWIGDEESKQQLEAAIK